MAKHNSQDGRKEMQRQTFTRWMNVYLNRRDPPAVVHNLFSDIQDGRILMTLLEELTGCKLLYRFRSSSHRIFRLNNISKALAFLDDRHVKLLGIDASAVADGVPSVVLNLIWNIILHFQVKEMTGGLRRRLSSSLSSLSVGSDLSELTDEPVPNSKSSKSPKYSGKTIKSLLQWAQRCTIKFGVEVHDFGRSWRSGLAFLALIKSINPDLVDLRQSFTKDPEKNLDQAFRTAHQSLDIPPLLEPQDLICSYPDEKSIITYVSMFLRHCPDIVEDLSAAATSPHISQFRSLETLVDREDVQPVFISSFETSHELLLWKRWAQRSSSSTQQNKRKSSSALQPPSPLDANVVNPEIHLWLDTSADRGYSKTKANEFHFSLSSEEGIYSLTPLDSDEEDAYSYILDLNEDLSKIQAKREVPRVEEESEEISPISNKEQKEFFTNSGSCESNVQIPINDLNGTCEEMSANIDQEQTGKICQFDSVELKKGAEKESPKIQVEEIAQETTSQVKFDKVEFQPQSNQDWEGDNEAIIENKEETDSTNDVALIIEWLEKTQNEVGWSKKKPIEDLHNTSDRAENKLQTPNVLIVDNGYENTKIASFIENLTEDFEETDDKNGCEIFTITHKEIVNETAQEIETRKPDSNGSTEILKTTTKNGYTHSNKKYQEASLSSEKRRVLVQSVTPSSGLSQVELHVLLFLSTLLYCYFIGREIISYYM
ncbi:dystrophin-like [Boleophthalmus pectinirostris]|uniref:dystrophin-like n=1 Tax=Boleophthalmus pectinirostris TaxID=150288 RepID=UPI000A1C5BF0|nr:dystrophin-like [Boleophthalmus pectinirostris]